MFIFMNMQYYYKHYIDYVRGTLVMDESKLVVSVLSSMTASVTAGFPGIVRV